MQKQIYIDGWKVSVISDGYGKEYGLFELGLKKESCSELACWHIQGFLSFEDVLDLIEKITVNPLKVYANLEA